MKSMNFIAEFRGVIHLVIFILSLSRSTHGAFRDEIKALAGGEVQLPCSINREECGDFHSIKWYKENRRVFVYSPFADFAKAEGELSERAQLMIDDNVTSAKLRLTELKTTDEGEYKCEITFLDIAKNCPVVQLVKLTTLAEPKFVSISLPEDKNISNSIIGPYTEGQELRLLCESGGGKPIPKVTWYNGSDILPGKSSSFEEPDGTGTGKNEVRIKLSRGDLGSHFTCKSENEAIRDNPMSSSVQVDVNLRPLNTEVIGSDEPILESSTVTLMCRTIGARPAAVITWYNGSRPFAEQSPGVKALQKPPLEVTVKQEDNTYETQSRISFTASRFENNEFITCEANNDILESFQEEPQRDSITLSVLYAPKVEIYPTNITVNESSTVTIYCKFDANPKNLTNVQWYRNGQFYEEGNLTAVDIEDGLSHVALILKNVSRDASGTYNCLLENEIGSGESSEPSILDVYYEVEVSLRMDPRSPISEADERNVTLFCDVKMGNPNVLSGVKWFMDGELLKELPQCDDENNMDLCDIDPSKLLLEHVSRHFSGNFSCQGVNEAGWSDFSDEKILEVFYSPGTAFIQKDHDEVVKGESLSLTCGVSDPGRPPASTYIWKRGGHVVNDVTTYNWTINPVTLETEANISCVAVNEVGRGTEDYISIQVLAPPTFIQRLPPYTGAMATTENFSLSCQVECSPLCDIFWLKDGIPIADDDSRYTIITESLPSNFAKNDFESVKSELIWRIQNWPNGKLDRETDNANFTCQSTENLVGTPGVSSDTYFRVEYPPENIRVSKEIVTVQEGKSTEKISCETESYPEANYIWKFNDEIITTDSNLLFDYGISRNQAGDYTCRVQNRHGSAEVSMLIDVQYKPECVIKQCDEDGYLQLTCESVANPTDVLFKWKKGNETIKGAEVDGLNSYLRLDPVEENFGLYYCYVNNSMGEGFPCELEVEGIGLVKMGNSNFIIVVTILAAIVVILLLLVVAYIMCCRKKKKPEEKYSNQNGNEERDNAYEVSPSSFRYYSSSVEYLTDIASKNNKTSPDSGHPDDPNAERAFYENLPFHQGMPQKQNMVDPLNETTTTSESYLVPSFIPPPPPSTHPSHPPPLQTSSPSSHLSRPPSQLSQNGSSGYGSTRSGAHNSILFVAPSGIRRSSPQFASLRVPSRANYSQVNIQEEDFETTSAIIDDAIFDLLEAEKEQGDNIGGSPVLDDNEDSKNNNRNQNDNNTHLNNILNLYHLLPPSSQYPSSRNYNDHYNNYSRSNNLNENQGAPHHLRNGGPFNYHQSLPRHFLRGVIPGAGKDQLSNPLGAVLRNSSNNERLRHQRQAEEHLLSSGRAKHPTFSNHPSRRTAVPLRTVSSSYYSTLSARTQTPNGSSGGVYPDTAIQPPRQFDSYYYHPATLNNNINHKHKNSHQSNNNNNNSKNTSSNNNPKNNLSHSSVQPPPSRNNTTDTDQSTTSTTASSGSGRIVYADLALKKSTGDNLNQQNRPPTSSTTDYAILKFNSQASVGQEIDV
ncbi:synaptogenesis protein syg-2 isoform X3 [Lepeophtheirus salmonis]|uniref:synaptogenesis protein syg-2 isoform X3 n=1 Tax=Lepeophtheirus salmonis TaxID=72036 RepID=UPI003AF4012B